MRRKYGARGKEISRKSCKVENRVLQCSWHHNYTHIAKLIHKMSHQFYYFFTVVSSSFLLLFPVSHLIYHFPISFPQKRNLTQNTTSTSFTSSKPPFRSLFIETVFLSLSLSPLFLLPSCKSRHEVCIFKHPSGPQNSLYANRRANTHT